MNKTGTNRHYIVDEISPEHFIPEHYFVYVSKGMVTGYDGSKYLELKSGECCIARKNRLGRYYKTRENNELDKTILTLDEAFLRKFQERHKTTATKFPATETFVQINKNDLLPDYIQSLKPYYNHGKIEEVFADVKREELLIILLQAQPELSGLFFDYGKPEKIDLEAFMNHNYKFNVTIKRFAYLTGRSLSAFKRDFKQIFNDTPNHWLVQKRLQEAHFLIDKRSKKSTEIYLDLGFESLSHFSFAFKNLFGYSPTKLSKSKKTSG